MQAFMRFFVSVLGLLLFVLTKAMGGDSAYMVLPVNSYDFGRISEDGGSVSHTFPFKNLGNIPLQITHVRTTCGCTVPSWSGEPVLPGSEGYITLTFDPAERKGAFHKTIQVQSNASNSNMFITLSGNILPPIKIEELHYKIGALSLKTSHINFGYLWKGSTGIETLTVANMSEKKLQVGFDSVPAHLELIAIPAILNPGEFGQIEVQYCTDKTDEWDVAIDQVAIVLNGAYDRNAMLTLTANIREDFSKLEQEALSSSPIAAFETINHSFDTLRGSDPVECRFMVTNTGPSNLIIRAVKASCGCTVVKPEKNILATGDSTYIEAVFNPKGRTGNFKNGITVITNDPNLYKQYLWIEGYIQK
jgi:hypothetical protein